MDASDHPHPAFEAAAAAIVAAGRRLGARRLISGRGPSPIRRRP
jgi:hypothetical protein